jgi:hypothetical protein
MTDQPEWQSRSSLTRSEQRIQDTVAITALSEIVRILIGHVAMHPDPAEFHNRLSRFDEDVATGISQRSAIGGSSVEDIFIKEAATAWASKLLAGIRHPKDGAGG